jgi:hypothetical protein
MAMFVSSKMVTQPNMKHLLTQAVLVILTTTAVQAQSATQPQSESSKVKATQIQRVDNADKLKAATPAKPAVKMEDIDRGIEELQRVLKENEGKEGFQKEAYQKRLDYLNKLKVEQTITPKSEQ